MIACVDGLGVQKVMPRQHFPVDEAYALLAGAAATWMSEREATYRGGGVQGVRG